MDHVHLHPLVRILQSSAQALSPRWNNPNYAAPYYRIYWNPTPGAQVLFAHRPTDLTPDRWIVIPPDTPYTARCDTSADHVYIHFLAQSRYRAAVPAIYVFPVTATIEALGRELHARPADPARELLLALTFAHLALSHMPPEAFRSQPDDDRIRPITAYLDEHYPQPITNPQLASMAGLNTNAFIRLFRETAGETPQAYLRRRRIEAACVALHYSTRTIDEIAAQTGFCDRFHFTKVFRQQRGLGPAAFRQSRETLPDTAIPPRPPTAK